MAKIPGIDVKNGIHMIQCCYQRVSLLPVWYSVFSNWCTSFPSIRIWDRCRVFAQTFSYHFPSIPSVYRLVLVIIFRFSLPLQVSLGRMIIDIIKFFFIYTLVLFAFGCGLNQLLWYYADLEKRKCYHFHSDIPDFDNNEKACGIWRRFAK